MISRTFLLSSPDEPSLKSSNWIAFPTTAANDLAEFAPTPLAQSIWADVTLRAKRLPPYFNNWHRMVGSRGCKLGEGCGELSVVSVECGRAVC